MDDVVVVSFRNDSYRSFMEYCFANALIKGVHLQVKGDAHYVLFLFAAAPGVEKAIKDFGGTVHVIPD